MATVPEDEEARRELLRQEEQALEAVQDNAVTMVLDPHAAAETFTRIQRLRALLNVA